MPPVLSARPRQRACLLTSAGAVAAAGAGHVGAGGTPPSHLLLGLLVPVLAGMLALLPKRLRTLRGQVVVAALLQPALHTLFGVLPERLAPPGRGLGAGLTLMLVAHALAGAAACWLLRSADRLVLAGSALARGLPELLAALVPLVPDRPVPVRVQTPPPLAGRVVSSSVRRRGPPVPAAHPCCS